MTTQTWTPLMEAVMHKALRLMADVKYMYSRDDYVMGAVDGAMYYFPATVDFTPEQVQAIETYMAECISDKEAIPGS